MRWNVTSDHLVYDLSDIALLSSELEPTKRQIIGIVGRFFDPIGFLAPVVIRFKVFFQRLCESKVSWDEPLMGELLDRWRSLMSGLQESQSIQIPRCYFCCVEQEVQSCHLCGFCDASISTYAAVVYLLVETSTQRIVKFVASKTRVSPLQGQTISRLELLSALLLAKLMKSVTSSLDPVRSHSVSRILRWPHSGSKVLARNGNPLFKTG